MKFFFLLLFSFSAFANNLPYPNSVLCNLEMVSVEKEEGFHSSISTSGFQKNLKPKGSDFYSASWGSKIYSYLVNVEFINSKMYTFLKVKKNEDVVFSAMTEAFPNENGAYGTTITGYGSEVTSLLEREKLKLGEAVKLDLFPEGSNFYSVFLKCF